MKKSSKKLLNTVLLLGWICVLKLAIGQVPEKINYQSVIRNASGELVKSGKVGMRMSILQETISGVAVYVETHTDSTNVNGLVSLELGGGTPVFSSLAAIDWNAGPYFLKVEIDPSGGSDYLLSGTSQILSVPYALQAKNSANGFATTWSDNEVRPMVDGTGNVGIGAPSSWEKLYVGGFLSVAPGTNTWGSQLRLASTSVDRGKVYTFTSTGGDALEGAGKLIVGVQPFGNALAIDTSLRIGIGTIDPQRKLDVAGGMRLFNEYGANLLENYGYGDDWNYAGYTLGDLSTGKNWGFQYTKREGMTDHFMIEYYNGSGWDTHFSINPWGNIGIGSVPSWEKLFVNGFVGIGPGYNSWGSQLQINSNSLDQGHSYCLTSTAGDAAQGPGKFLLGLVSKGTAISVDSNLYVGIGTENPERPLDVAVAMRLRNDSGASYLENYGLGDSWNYSGLVLGDRSSGINWAIQHSKYTDQLNNLKIEYYNGSTYSTYLTMKPDGNVGVGTNQPNSKLQVANGDVSIETIGTGLILKSPDGSCWRLTVDDTGQVVSTKITCP